MKKFIPLSQEQKPTHLFYKSKGLKGLNVAPRTSIIIKSKSFYLFKDVHREVCGRIFGKAIRELNREANIKFYPSFSRTKKPLQVRMGKGKGSHDHWVAL